MLLTLKALDGGTVVIETHNLLYIAGAADAQTKQPIVNGCAVVFAGGQVLVLRGSPSEVADIIEHGHPTKV